MRAACDVRSHTKQQATGTPSHPPNAEEGSEYLAIHGDVEATPARPPAAPNISNDHPLVHHVCGREGGLPKGRKIFLFPLQRHLKGAQRSRWDAETTKLME
jgi:hypothetical protein